MKTHRMSWIAGLVAAGFIGAAASAVALGAEPPLLHPEDARVTTPSHTPADLDLTRKIRDALTKNEALTFLAKNVVIDARDGNVTLSGTVRDLAERRLVEEIATRVAGPGRVTSGLEVPNIVYIRTLG